MFNDYINVQPKRTVRSRTYSALHPYIPTIMTTLWVLAWVAMTIYVLLY